MIGLPRANNHGGVHHNEGPETRDLSKDKLYQRLGEQWLLPPIQSKGVSRSWLIRVWNGEVYRVANREFKLFEADISTNHMKRNGFTNLLHLLLRMNQLLISRQQLPLGFNEFCVPDEKWLAKIARFIDRTNVLEFFQMPVEQITVLRPAMPVVDRIHFCRDLAHRQLLVRTGHMQRPGIYGALLAVSEWHRKGLAKQIEADECRIKAQEAEREHQVAVSSLRDYIIKASCAIYGLENPAFRSEALLNDGEGLNDQDRNRIRTVME